MVMFYMLEGLFMITFLSSIYDKLQTVSKKPLSQNKRLPFFDVLKAIAIFAIILIHMSDMFSNTSLIKEILWVALSLFIIESGYLLHLHHKKTLEPKRYIKNIVKRILIIYLIFVICIHIYLNQSFSFIEIIKDAFFGRTNQNYYFIPIMLQLYMLYIGFRKISTYLLSFFGMSLIACLSYLFHILNHNVQQPYWNSNLWSLAFFGRFLFFFCFGMLISQYDISKITWRKMKIPLLFFIFGVSVLSFHSNKLYLTYSYGLAMFLSLILLYNKISPHISFVFPILIPIGQQSLIIYLIHTRFIYDIMFPYVISHITINILTYIVSSIFILTISSVFSIYFMKTYNGLMMHFFKVHSNKLKNKPK